MHKKKIHEIKSKLGPAVLIAALVLAALMGIRAFHKSLLPKISFEESMPSLKQDKSQEEIRAWYDYVQEHQVITTTIDISSCKPEPRIVLASLASTITFTNKDDVPHQIYSSGGRLTVPAKSSAKFVVNFPRGRGVHTYACDRKQVGALSIN
jgi:plastocyanin